jgi:hypothetical protein
MTTKNKENKVIENQSIQYANAVNDERIAFIKIMKTHINRLKIEDLFMSHLSFPNAIYELKEKLYEICLNATYSKFNQNDFYYYHESVKDEPEYIKELYFDDNFYDLLMSPE